ncbi:MAG: hypothetical protein BWY36_00217 [Candidatus Diapherotrites archaeon ADurb.Bin253]|nr:MAG: hypothetical protein BWY36_00217 [Candidatus Diapherotrites archaeon ADurb.Bin253]
MRCKNIFILVFAVVLFGLASASFQVSEKGSMIKNKYEPSEYLQATLNISFFNQSLNSTFNDSLGNSVSLSTLLSQSYNIEYSSIPFDSTNTSINSAPQLFYIAGTSFQMPATEGNITYRLDLDGQKLFEKVLEISSRGKDIEKILASKYVDLNISKYEISEYDISTQKILNESFKIKQIEEKLNLIKSEYEKGSSSEYENLLENLTEIRIPKKISKTANVNPMTFYPDREAINLHILAQIDGGEFLGKENEYIDAVYIWNNEKLKTTVKFNEITAYYEAGNQEVVNVYTFNFDKSKMKEEAYMIIGNLENVVFEDETLPVKEYNGYLYFNLNDVYDTVSFSTTSNINFLDIPVFISPSIDKLTPPKIGDYERWQKPKKWALFVLIVIILVLISVISYILLQIWYRKKYETYLFKTKNNLYNIMVYIQGAKRKGMSRDDIIKNLKKAGWTKEQVNYALQKYEGKKIAGLIHPPLNIGSQEQEKKPKKK